MKQKITLAAIFSVLGLAVTVAFGPNLLRKSLPAFSLHYVEPEAAEQGRALPFFGVMMALPHQDGFTLLPKLEYRHGPPNRYLSKLAYLVVGPKGDLQERIEFFGRRTLDDWLIRSAEFLTKSENWSYASFVQASLEFADSGRWPDNQSSRAPLLSKWLFYWQAKRFLGSDSQEVYIMNQAGTPAFLAYAAHRSSIGERARIWFLKRNALFEVRLESNQKLATLDPVKLFRRSFVLETRQDALAFVARGLSEVQLNTEKLTDLSFSQFEWPLLLLGSKLSIDPSSIHAFFHFAGLNALLFREHGKSTDNLEIVDSIRNNVLVSERYGSDVAPDSEQSAEMGRLARAMVKMF